MGDTLAPSKDNYIKGGATILFRRRGATGYLDLGNIADFSLSPTGNYSEHKTSRSGRLVTDRKERSAEGFSIKISQDEFNAENLALILNAPTPAAFSQASTTSNLTITDPDLGPKYDLGAVMLSSVSVTNGSNTTFIEGTDYTVELDLGMIRFLPTGSINNSTVVTVEVTAPAVTGMTVAPLKTDGLLQGDVVIRFNAEDGRKFIYRHTTATLEYTGDIAMSGTTFAKAQGTLTMEADPSSADMYGRWTLLPAA